MVDSKLSSVWVRMMPSFSYDCKINTNTRYFWKALKKFNDSLPSIFWQDIALVVIPIYLLWSYPFFTLIRRTFEAWVLLELAWWTAVLPLYIKLSAPVPDLAYRWPRSQVINDVKWDFAMMLKDRKMLIQFCEGWHDGLPMENITFESMRSLIAEMYLERHFPEELPKCSKEQFDLVSSMVKEIERSSGNRFTDGPLQDHLYLRKNFGYKTLCMPLTIYGILYLQNYINSILMRYHGFRHRWMGCLEYWYRPANTPHPTKCPQFFFHGIGVGLLPYYSMYSRLSRERHVVIPEFRWVQLRIFQSKPMTEDIMKAIQKIHLKLRLPKVQVIAHSYGSFVANNCSHYLQNIVEQFIMIDPAAAGSNFPKGIRQIHYGKNSYLDVDMSYALHYQVRGPEGCLRPHKLSHNSMIILSELDKIVPSYYIKKCCRGTLIKVIILEQQGHGDFLFRSHGASGVHRDIAVQEDAESEESSFGKQFDEFSDNELAEMTCHTKEKQTLRTRSFGFVLPGKMAEMQTELTNTMNVMNGIDEYLQ